MSDDHVVLRPAREDDLPVLERFLSDPQEAGPFQWIGWFDPSRWRRRWAENGLLGPDSGQLVIARGPDDPDGADEPLGFVSWRKIDRWGGQFYWNVGAQLLADVRGRGIGTRAQRLLVDYLFANTTAVRIEADTDVENIAEQRALEKAGFTREGELRSSTFRAGRWRDAVLYSVLRDDLPAVAD